MTTSSPSARRLRAVESFGCAASAIGPIEPGMSLFALTAHLPSPEKHGCVVAD